MHRIVAFSCLHAPKTHKGYFDWLLKVIEDFKPHHVVNLGDWYEGLAASRWPRHIKQDWDVYDEHDAVAYQADSINEAAPEAKKHWIWGNHCANLLGDEPGRLPDDLRKAVQWRNYVRTASALADWNVVERYGDNVRLRLGPVTFQHGTAQNVSAEKDKAYTHGTPNGLYVMGHTHRPLALTQARERQVTLPYWYMNPGCGMDFEWAFYMRRCSMALWGRGAVLIECPGVQQYRTAYATPQWDAQLLVHSYAVNDGARPTGRLAQTLGS